MSASSFNGRLTVNGEVFGDSFEVFEVFDVFSFASETTYNGGGGADIVWTGLGYDSLSGGAGRDQLRAGFGDDIVFGGRDRDLVDGGGGNDTLLGGSGDDKLVGWKGDDVLVGGYGSDDLFGGKGADLFQFNGVRSSHRLEDRADLIAGFETGIDVIDVSGIDANPLSGADDAFVLVEAFTGTRGEAVLRAGATGTVLELDTNGNGQANFTLVIEGSVPTPDDLIL